jgi:uncharacterized protein (DUF1499 family)
MTLFPSEFGRWLAIGIGLLVLLALALVVIGQLGGLAGKPPGTLGLRDGKLKPPSGTPNSVSSQADLWPGPMSEYARIAPLPASGDAAATMARLKSVIEAMPGATVIEARPDYLYVQFRTRWLGFVDDAEFWFDPQAKVVQVRSASRLGRRDFGANRAHIEAVRARLAGL